MSILWLMMNSLVLSDRKIFISVRLLASQRNFAFSAVVVVVLLVCHPSFRHPPLHPPSSLLPLLLALVGVNLNLFILLAGFEFRCDIMVSFLSFYWYMLSPSLRIWISSSLLCSPIAFPLPSILHRPSSLLSLLLALVGVNYNLFLSLTGFELS